MLSILAIPIGSEYGFPALFEAVRKNDTRRRAGLFLNAFSIFVALVDPLSRAAWTASNELSHSGYFTTGKSRTFENADIIEDQGVGLGWTRCRISFWASSAPTIAPAASYAVTQETD